MATMRRTREDLKSAPKRPRRLSRGRNVKSTPQKPNKEVSEENGRASAGSSGESDFVSPVTAASPDAQKKAMDAARRKVLWATPDGKTVIFRKTRMSSYWHSNLAEGDGSMQMFRTRGESRLWQKVYAGAPLILISELHYKVRVRLFSDEQQSHASFDASESWVPWNRGRWVGDSDDLITPELREEGWSTDGPNVGKACVREFDGDKVVGVVIAHAKKQGRDSPAMWRVMHADGDIEDLEKHELDAALQLAKDWDKPSSACDSLASARAADENALIRAIDGSSKKPKAVMAAKKSSTKGAAKKKKSKTPESKGKEKEEKKKKKKSQGSDSDDDDDSDFDDEEASSSSEEDDDDHDDDNDGTGDSAGGKKTPKPQALPTLPLKFVPAEWGPGSEEAQLYAQFLRSLSGSTGTSKKRKRVTRKSGGKKGAGKGGKGKGKGGKGGKGGARKGPAGKGVPSKGKKSSWSDEEDDSDEESDLEDEDESEEEDIVRVSSRLPAAGDRWENGLFFFAKRGDVVDEDGIDLGPSLLHTIGWHRIVLDEAHKIKDRVNSTAKATLALRGRVSGEGEEDRDGGHCHRWCLTGTPLQNRVGELYSLVRFLRISPFAYYFCKAEGCGCKSLQWSFRGCDHCSHTPMRHYSYFNKNIINPIKRYGYVGEGKHAMKLLRDDLLGKLMLRRTKAERQKDIQLPPASVTIRKLEFAAPEKDFYESVFMGTRAKFDHFVEKGTLLHNYAHIFELLSRLRRAADHPYLVVHGANEDNYGEIVSQRQLHRTDVCGICHLDIETIEECALASCRHTFHKTCIGEFFESFKGEAMETGKGRGGRRGRRVKVEDDDEDEPNFDDDVDDEGDVKPSRKRQRGGAAVKSEKGGDSGPGANPNCPQCFLPLSVMLDIKGGTEANQAKVAAVNAEDETADVCVVCMDSQRDCLLVPCGHLFICMKCAKAMDKRQCPMCRKDITKMVRVDPNSRSTAVAGAAAASEGGAAASLEDIPASTNVLSGLKTSAALLGRKSILQRIDLSQFSSSTKVDSVVGEIEAMLKDEDPNAEIPNKAIVFSQYNDMLDLVEWRLKSQLGNKGVKSVKLVGSLAMNERRAVLHAFKTQREVRVILMSLKAGGEGLNLQEANLILMIDPWWNPSVEMQAIQRAHRIGQKRAVRAVRFVTKNSIEEKMMELQDKKMLVFEGAIGGSQAAMAKLTEEDLRFLFSGG